MTDSLVSIIMPSWNTADYIADSIRSVLGQSYTNWELIIVDDCSTDGSYEVIRPFLADSRIRYYENENNMGAALTRNRALRKARGEWIAFLDSDDLWRPDKLEKQISFMEDNGYVLSYTSYEKIDEKGALLGIRVTGPAIVDRHKMYQYDYIGQLTMMYSARFFGLIQIEDIRKNNDYAIRLRLFAKGGTKAFLLDENLAQYRVRTSSISHDKITRKLKSHYDLFRVNDARPAAVALWFACRNMVFGVWKKMRYEKRIAK